MEKTSKITVRQERQAHRDAIRRLREAYEQLRKAGAEIEENHEQEAEHIVQEVKDENPSCIVCQSVDIATGARSDD